MSFASANVDIVVGATHMFYLVLDLFASLLRIGAVSMLQLSVSFVVVLLLWLLSPCRPVSYSCLS